MSAFVLREIGLAAIRLPESERFLLARMLQQVSVSENALAWADAIEALIDALGPNPVSDDPTETRRAQSAPQEPNAIRKIRKCLGVTQTVLGEALGVTQGNVHFYEARGQVVPPSVAKRLIEYAASLGHKVTYEEIYADIAPAADSPPSPQASEEAPA